MKQEKPLNKRTLIAITIVCGVLVTGIYMMSRPLSADAVERLSIHALETHDAKALLDLTLPEERDKLHLTEDNVTGFLKQTIWKSELPLNTHSERVAESHGDEILYDVTSLPKRNMAALPARLQMMITLSKDERWHLALSFLLFQSVATDLNAQYRRGAHQQFMELAKRWDIKGLRDNAHGYMMVENNLAPSASQGTPAP